MFIECTFLFRLCVSLIFRQFNCLLILRCLCNCAQCDYGLFGGGLIVIVNHVFSRRSRSFLKGRPLSCEVPTRRDSVGGGGGSSTIFRGLRKPTRFSGGRVVAEFFRGLRKPLPPPESATGLYIILFATVLTLLSCYVL